MPDVRMLWRAMSPRQPLVNARREVAEHARIEAEVEAVIARIGSRGDPRGPARSHAGAGPGAQSLDSPETLESSARAS